MSSVPSLYPIRVSVSPRGDNVGEKRRIDRCSHRARIGGEIYRPVRSENPVAEDVSDVLRSIQDLEVVRCRRIAGQEAFYIFDIVADAVRPVARPGSGFVFQNFDGGDLHREPHDQHCPNRDCRDRGEQALFSPVAWCPLCFHRERGHGGLGYNQT
jgi:hypothetical protein